MDQKFSTQDLLDLGDLVANAWNAGADRDWSVPAGKLAWDCWHTADHAINAVMVPAFFLASGRTDRYPDIGSGFHAEPDATVSQLLDRLNVAVRVLAAVITAADPGARGLMFPSQTASAEDFAPRGGFELILHAHDVCTGLGVPFDPPADLCRRLRDHTASWSIWTSRPPAWPWNTLPLTDDPWADLLVGSGRA